jgi:putative transposase
MGTPNPSDEFSDRRHPAHGVKFDPRCPTIVFVTVCTKGRRPVLASAECHAALREVWTAARAWLVGRYVIMPDHLHLFAAPGEIEIELDNWIRYWKSLFSRRSVIEGFQWQTDHWDRRLRSSESYESKWQYVLQNPVRHGLVVNGEAWPFQGEMNVLPW